MGGAGVGAAFGHNPFFPPVGGLPFGEGAIYVNGMRLGGGGMPMGHGFGGMSSGMGGMSGKMMGGMSGGIGGRPREPTPEEQAQARQILYWAFAIFVAMQIIHWI